MNNLKRVTLAKEMEDPYYLKDPKILELYQKCLPPKDAYYYFPEGEEIIIHNRKKPNKSLRRVHYNVPYTEQEKKWLADFKQLISSHPEIHLPDFFEDYLLLAFIYSTGCDLKESYKRVVDYIKFSSSTFPIVIKPNSKFIEILNRGFVYVHGRDSRFRPILVCQCKIFQKYYKNYDIEEILKAVYFLCQFIINNMLIPGQIENWIFILNLTGVSLLSLPEPIKKMIPALSNYFLARLYKNYIMGLNFMTRILYKIACNFLDDVTVAKLNVLDSMKDPKLFEIIRKDNIEEQFGGTAPNLPVDPENGFFPPRMPSQYFIKENENPSNILISEDEYINRYKNGQITERTVSPYIFEKIKKEEIEESNNKVENVEVEEIQEIAPQTINNSEQKKSTIKIDKSIMDEQEMIRKELDKKRNILLMKNLEKERVKKFINYNNWNFDDEFSHLSLQSRNSRPIDEGNILEDIHKFQRKKQNFISKISLMNKIRNSYISNY